MAGPSQPDSLTHIDLRISIEDATALLNMGLAKEVQGINSADFVLCNVSKWFLIISNRLSAVESQIAQLKGEIN